MITICCISGKRFESLNPVAERYNVTPKTCRKWIKEGKLPYIIRAGKLAGVYDDTGKRYKSALEMSHSKNIPYRHMMRLIDLDPFGMFRDDWLNPPNGTLTVCYRNDLWWFNDSIPVNSIKNGESVTHRKLGHFRHAAESMIEARDTGEVVIMGKHVRCVENGEVYSSVGHAAEAVGVTPGMIVHVLKGRKKTAGGFRWEYTGGKTSGSRQQYLRGRIVRDDAGNVYDSVKSMSVAKGIDTKRAYYLLRRDPEGIFRNEHLRPLPRHRFVFTGRGIDKRETQRAVFAVAPNMSVQKLHNALDKVIYEGHDASSVYYGETGWEIEIVTHDLFAKIGRMRR